MILGYLIGKNKNSARFIFNSTCGIICLFVKSVDLTPQLPLTIL